MFAMTFGGLIWLAGTVDRGISNQSAATSIAFQAARSGAQAAQVEDLRGGATILFDAGKAVAAAQTTANKLLNSYGVSGSASPTANPGNRTVTVTVTITDGSKTVTGVGSAEAVIVN